MPGDGKSSHCLWQGELKNQKEIKQHIGVFHLITDTPTFE
jgi:hypothetical protein